MRPSEIQARRAHHPYALNMGSSMRSLGRPIDAVGTVNYAEDDALWSGVPVNQYRTVTVTGPDGRRRCDFFPPSPCW